MEKTVGQYIYHTSFLLYTIFMGTATHRSQVEVLQIESAPVSPERDRRPAAFHRHHSDIEAGGARVIQGRYLAYCRGSVVAAGTRAVV